MSSQFPDLGVDVPAVTASELKERLDAGESVTVLDTRRPADFAAWKLSAPGVTSVNVPFYEFLDGDGEPVADLPDGVPDGPLVVSCAKGISSQFVAELLASRGREVEALTDGMRGWARLYERQRLATDGDGVVVQFHRPSSGCLAYLVVGDGEAAVVDPLRAFVDEYRAAAGAYGADLVYAVDTHVHADHVSGARELAAATDATHLVPSGAEDRGLVGEDYETVADGDVLDVGGVAVETVALPGHTSEMTGFRVGDVLLGGDTLFVDGVARPDLEHEAQRASERASGDEPRAHGEADAADAARQLYDTLQEVSAMPDGTVVAPAHASEDAETATDGSYTARLGDLRERLDAFGMDREAFVDAILDGMPPRPNNYEAIIDVNLGRRDVDDEEAFELELGPNNCAAG